jgi:hypothetical protein
LSGTFSSGLDSVGDLSVTVPEGLGVSFDGWAGSTGVGFGVSSDLAGGGVVS